jgi:hypothetical protein
VIRSLPNIFREVNNSIIDFSISYRGRLDSLPGTLPLGKFQRSATACDSWIRPRTDYPEFFEPSFPPLLK